MNYDPYAASRAPSPEAGGMVSNAAAGWPKAPWEIGELLRSAWKAFKADWVVLALAPCGAMIAAMLPLVVGISVGTSALRSDHPGIFLILAGGGMLLTSVLLPFVLVGLVRMATAAARGEKTAFRVAISGTDRIVPIFLGSLIMGVAVELGLFLLVVPGVIMAIGFSFTPYLVVEENMAPLDAMRTSWELSQGRKMDLFVFHLVAASLLVAGGAACGLGTFVALPIVLIAHATIFVRLTGRQAAPAPEPPFRGPPPPGIGFGGPSSSGGFPSPAGAPSPFGGYRPSR